VLEAGGDDHRAGFDDLARPIPRLGDGDFEAARTPLRRDDF